MPMTTINFTLSQLHVLRERSLRNQLLMHLCVRRHQSRCGTLWHPPLT
jgi:hypothetical protein